MHYTLHQLQIFLKITETQSITKASEELHLTQPAVSIQLKNFQDQFEFPLTEMIGRKLYITDFGKEIAAAAERILNEVHAINYKVVAYKGQLSGRLRITVVSTGKYIIPYFLVDFLNAHPGVELVLDVTNKFKVVQSMEQNEVDFTLLSIVPDHLVTERIDLMENRLYFISSRKTVESLKGPLKRTDLEKMPLIYREKGSGTRHVMEQFIEQQGISVNKKMELTSNEAVKQAIIAGLGSSIMPLIGIKNELLNGDLCIVPMEGLPIVTQWSLVWLKSKNFSPVAKAYHEYLLMNKERIIKERFSWYQDYAH